jgi:hypothetical protein
MDQSDVLSSYEFSDDAKMVLRLAIEEARRQNSFLLHSYHLLMGIIRLAGLGWRILVSNGIDISDLSMRLEQIQPQPHKETTAEDPNFSTGVLSIIANANDAAMQLTDSAVIDTEHILLGILRVSDCTAARILSAYKIKEEAVLETLKSPYAESKTSEAYIKQDQNEKDDYPDRNQPLLRVIKESGLNKSEEIDSLIPLAWHAEKYKRGDKEIELEQYISLSSIFYAAIVNNVHLTDVLIKSGLSIERFYKNTNLTGFEAKTFSEPSDIITDGVIFKYLEKYKKDFPVRNVFDALTIVYSFIAYGRGTFKSIFKEAGGDIQKATEALRKLVEAKAGKTVAARLHSDLWTFEDQLDYDLYATSIFEFIKHPKTRPPLVIGVQAPWGQGKTSLMRMVQKKLDKDHPDLKKEDNSDTKTEKKSFSPIPLIKVGELREFVKTGKVISEGEGKIDLKGDWPTVWFNAWKYQSSEQIWAGMAHSILSQLTSRLDSQLKIEWFWLKLHLRRINTQAIRTDIYQTVLEKFIPQAIGWLGLILLSIITFILFVSIETWAGVGSAITAAWGALQSWKKWTGSMTEALEKKLEGKFTRYVQQPDYSEKLGFLHLVEQDMRQVFDLLIDKEKPLVVFIDDLDRCSPAKVGQIIEAINLFLAGDYGECIFVLGMDAQVVAASMEVVHEEIIGKMADRKGELGWLFMDKFIQLPFVIPRLKNDQKEAYLGKLALGVEGKIEQERPDTEKEQDEQEIVKFEKEISSGNMEVKEVLDKGKEIKAKFSKTNPEAANKVVELSIGEVAKKFTDEDPEMFAALTEYKEYLSDNPRTIKRAVNLYRFHYFISEARHLSPHDLLCASPEQIARWIVVIIRWPHFVRWLQKCVDITVDSSKQRTLKSKDDDSNKLINVVIQKAKQCKSVTGWTEALEKAKINHSGWGTDRDLWRFLRAKISGEDIKLVKAPDYGLW